MRANHRCAVVIRQGGLRGACSWVVRSSRLCGHCAVVRSAFSETGIQPVAYSLLWVTIATCQRELCVFREVVFVKENYSEQYTY